MIQASDGLLYGTNSLGGFVSSVTPGATSSEAPASHFSQELHAPDDAYTAYVPEELGAVADGGNGYLHGITHTSYTPNYEENTYRQCIVRIDPRSHQWRIQYLFPAPTDAD